MTNLTAIAGERRADVAQILPSLVGVMTELPGIGKERQMEQGQRYKYRSIEDILPELQPLLSKHSVVVVPEVIDRLDGTHVTNNGSTWNDCTLTIRWRFYSAIDGSSVDAVTVGVGSDAGDKAANKATTASWKYAIVTTFCINDADDPDHTSSTEMAQAQPARSVARKADSGTFVPAVAVLKEGFPGATEEPNVPAGEKPISAPQINLIKSLLRGRTDLDTAADEHALMSKLVGREIKSTKDLTMPEAKRVIDHLKGND